MGKLAPQDHLRARHRVAGLRPEITTFCPAVEGLGEAAMVRLPVVHGAGVQQLPEAVQQGARSMSSRSYSTSSRSCSTSSRSYSTSSRSYSTSSASGWAALGRRDRAARGHRLRRARPGAGRLRAARDDLPLCTGQGTRGAGRTRRWPSRPGPEPRGRPPRRRREGARAGRSSGASVTRRSRDRPGKPSPFSQSERRLDPLEHRPARAPRRDPARAWRARPAASCAGRGRAPRAARRTPAPDRRPAARAAADRRCPSARLAPTVTSFAPPSASEPAWRS